MKEHELWAAYALVISARMQADRSACPRPEEILHLLESGSVEKRRATYSTTSWAASPVVSSSSFCEPFKPPD